MSIKTTLGLLLLIVALVVVPEASALPSILADFNTKYGTAGTTLDTCSTCHGPPYFTVVPNNPVNYYGRDLFNSGINFGAIEGIDSDGDGYTNLVEINARTFPGDPASHPTDTTAPVISSATLSTTTPNTGDPITVTVIATDNVGVTNVTADTVALTLQSGNTWSGTITAAAGTNVVIITAKDAAGNSATASASYTATTPPTPDTTAPIISSANLSTTTPNTGDPITVTVVATDNVGVTGVTADTVALTLQSGNTWSGTITAAAGTNVVTITAKDAAGNSATASASYTATTPPTTCPPEEKEHTGKHIEEDEHTATTPPTPVTCPPEEKEHTGKHVEEDEHDED